MPAGICAPAGAYAGVPAWLSRQRWRLQVVCLLAQHRDWAREAHVAPDTAQRVAWAHIPYADHGTGRHCRPTNERLAADLQVSTRTVQRARVLLKRLQLLTEVVRGRSIMTRAERLAAWRRGSSHRHIAAEFALTSPRHPQHPLCPVDDVTPPAPTVGGERISSKNGVLRRQRPKDERSAHSQKALEPSEGTARSRTQLLIAGLQQRVAWLRGISPARLTSLHRFARQRWTERDVLDALDQVLRARGWRIPDEVEHPAAYLASLLRAVDPLDRPGAIEEAMIAEEKLRRAWVWTTSTGPACEHGQPGGDVPHPVDGHYACSDCRREMRDDAAFSWPEVEMRNGSAD